jgi:Asp-tRNA(Asn)/Glu-tRNA(Gln) amidotransferase A subunit family amidase
VEAGELCYLTASEALRLFAARELSPVELTEAVLKRAEETEPSVNAFATLYPDEARAAARKAEARYLGKGPAPRPLEGLTVAIKELTPLAGQQHTQSCLALKDVIATESAPAAERIVNAGGIVHGRTNSPEFGCATFTHSRLFGLTRNPWNLDYSPAGSSGGAAAALALGSTTLAQGSDSAGSLRLPASACGVVGFKPPYGRVPGLPPYAFETANSDGPMARTVDDCALLENVIAGPHLADPNSVQPKLTIPANQKGLDGVRISLLVGIDGMDIDREVEANTRSAAAAMADAGAIVDEVELGWSLDTIMEAVGLHFSATYWPRVRRVLDGNRELLTSYIVAFADAHAATPVPSDFELRSHEITTELWRPLAEVFKRSSALLFPTLALPAPEAGKEYIDEGPIINGREQSDRWIIGTTVPFNLLSRLPVISVPTGFASNGVPTGIQIAGRPYDDRTVFRIARGFALERPWLDRADARPQLA